MGLGVARHKTTLISKPFKATDVSRRGCLSHNLKGHEEYDKEVDQTTEN